jgi:hypothetical protein
MRTTTRARYRRPQTDHPLGPVPAHTSPGKRFPDSFPARGADVWIDGTAHGDVPVPFELLDLAAVHGHKSAEHPHAGHPISAADESGTYRGFDGV